MANLSGNAGAFRQEAFTWQSLRAAARHEERKDITGRGDAARGITGRVVRQVPPLVYRDGQIGIPAGWSPDGDWDCRLEADYEAHVVGVRRHGKVGDDLGLHALVQFPALMPVETEDDERLMLRSAVAFVDRTHGGRAVFHARLDRDEDGRRTVDVFFVPTYAKEARKGAKASVAAGQRWASLSKHQKELAAAQGLPVDKIGRGRALQTAWFEYLRDGLGLGWAERGASKKRGRDRVEPEIYKLRRERALAEAAQLAAMQAQASLEARQTELSRREEEALFSEIRVNHLLDQQRHAEERIEADRQALSRREEDAMVEALRLEDMRKQVAGREHAAAAYLRERSDRLLKQHRERMHDLDTRAEDLRVARIELNERDQAVRAGMEAFLAGDIVKAWLDPERGPVIQFRPGFDKQAFRALIGRWWAAVVEWLQPLQNLFVGIEPEKRQEMAPAVIARRRRDRGMGMD